MTPATGEAAVPRAAALPRVSWHGGEEHWAVKEDAGVRLFLWRKTPPANVPVHGSLLFIHGSSMASQPTFDLQVPGRDAPSAMDWFAARGFDTWCLDNEGYGRSDKHRPVNCDIACGAQDVEAAARRIAELTGRPRLDLFGVSSGALKAAAFAQAHPERVGRLVLEAMVWKGTHSPTLNARRSLLASYQRDLRRPISRADIEQIFLRDRHAVADPETIAAFADAVLSLDDSVPNGSYVDMCAKLPVVDPTLIVNPTLVLRGEHDGIASEADVSAFFSALGHPDKHLAWLRGTAHGSFHGPTRLVAFHVVHAFLMQPEAGGGR